MHLTATNILNGLDTSDGCLMITKNPCKLHDTEPRHEQAAPAAQSLLVMLNHNKLLMPVFFCLLAPIIIQHTTSLPAPSFTNKTIINDSSTCSNLSQAANGCVSEH